MVAKTEKYGVLVSRGGTTVTCSEKRAKWGELDPEKWGTEEEWAEEFQAEKERKPTSPTP